MCHIIWATLQASKTFKKPGQRSYHWLPAPTGSFHLGTVTIIQGKRDADSYQVDEDCSEYLGPDVRRFHLANQSTDGAVYAVTIGPRGNNCSGEWCGRGRTCKHRDAVADLIERGAFTESPDQPAPACPHCADFGSIPTADMSAIPCPVCSGKPVSAAA